MIAYVVVQDEGRLVAFVEWDNGACGDYPLFECPFGDAAMGLRATLALHSASFSHAPRVHRPVIPRSAHEGAVTAKTGIFFAGRYAFTARENTYPRADDILAGRRTGHAFYAMHTMCDLMCDQLRYSPARMFCVEAVGADGAWQCAYACDQDAYVFTSWLAEVLLKHTRTPVCMPQEWMHLHDSCLVHAKLDTCRARVQAWMRDIVMP